MAEKKKKKVPKKPDRRPTIKQINAAKKVLENIGKENPQTLGEILKEVGYSEAIAKNPQMVTESDGFKELMEKAGLDDASLAGSHKELLDQKKIEYFVFPKDMEDEEIKEHVLAAGLRVITVRRSDKGKMAFYSIADAQAKKSALEMAYKLKGHFKGGEGGNTIIPIQINNLLEGKKSEYGI